MILEIPAIFFRLSGTHLSLNPVSQWHRPWGLVKRSMPAQLGWFRGPWTEYRLEQKQGRTLIYRLVISSLHPCNTHSGGWTQDQNSALRTARVEDAAGPVIPRPKSPLSDFPRLACWLTVPLLQVLCSLWASSPLFSTEELRVGSSSPLICFSSQPSSQPSNV